MSINEDKNWLLGRIISAIETLNNSRGSRVSEIMAEIAHDNPCQGDLRKFDEKCDRFREAFLYGVNLELLVHDRNLARYKIMKTGPKVGRYLQTTGKLPLPESTENKAEICGPTPQYRLNGNVVDPHYKRQQDKFSYSGNEII